MSVLASSLLGQQLFYALVEGFAALGSVMSVVSGFLAFFSLVEEGSSERIGEAVNYGIAYGFLPGVTFGTAIFVSSVLTL
jgi:hypothetical protein